MGSIKKILLLSFIISFAYAISKLPTYWHTTTIDGKYVEKIFQPSDFVFNLVGWFLPILIVLLAGQTIIKWAVNLETPFEKALSLVTKIFYILIASLALTVLILIPLTIFGVRLWAGNSTTENANLGLMATIAPFGLAVFIILIILDVITMRLLNKRSQTGWYLAFPVSLINYLVPPWILPLVIWWFLIKYRNFYHDQPI